MLFEILYDCDKFVPPPVRVIVHGSQMNARDAINVVHSSFLAYLFKVSDYCFSGKRVDFDMVD